jgi:hypothetical protein
LLSSKPYFSVFKAHYSQGGVTNISFGGVTAIEHAATSKI